MKKLLILLITLVLLCSCAKPVVDSSPLVREGGGGITLTGEAILPSPEPSPEPPDFGEGGEDSGLALYVGGRHCGSLALSGGERWAEATAAAEGAGGSCTYDGDALISVTLGDNTVGFDREGRGLTVNGELREWEPFYFGGRLMLPLALLTELTALDLYDGEAAVYLTDITRASELSGDYTVPVLMYHAVSDTIWGSSELFVSPAKLDEQLGWLKENGYTCITFEDLKNIENIEKPVLLTFDDGYRDNYTELFPLLKKHNVKATVFQITDAIGNELYLTEEMLREMSDSGLVSVQSHTVHHPELDTVTGEELIAELRDSSLRLMEITGKRPFVLCYPTGKYNQETLDAAKSYYEFATPMGGPRWKTSDDPLRIHRVYVSRSMSLSSFAAALK